MLNRFSQHTPNQDWIKPLELETLPKKEHAKHYGGKKCEICSRDAHRSTCVSKLYPIYWKQSTNYLRATLDGSVNSQHSSFMCSAAGSSMWGSARVPGRNVWKLA
jgi:hypothetical protein